MRNRFPLFAIWSALVCCSTAVASPGQVPDALQAGWQGKAACELLHETVTHRVLRCSFPPGAGHERHFHPPHFGYALSGGIAQLTDENGTRVVTLADNSHYESAGTPWHEMRNIGETEIVYIIVEQLDAGH